MSINIGPKISVEGEREYRTQMAQIIQMQKTLTSELKATAAGFDKNASAQDKAKASIGVLTKQVENQKRAVALITDQWEKAKNALGENDVNTLKYKDNLNKATAELADMERQLREAQDAANGLGDTMDTAGDAVEDFGNEADSASDDAFSLNSVMEHFSAGALLDALKAAGQAAIDFSKECIESAADVEATNAQFAQTFGDMEKAATDALNKIAKETGISATRMKKSYSAIYAFAKTAGAESEDALDISARAMQVAADSAAYYDRSIEEVTDSLQSFLKGNYANDAALGIAATETTRNTKANEMYATSFNKLTEAQKVDVLLAMVEAGNQASGALGQAARESDAWANVTGELSEAWKQFTAVIGGPILSAVTPILQGITGALQDLSGGAKTAAEGIAESIDQSAKSIEDAEKSYSQSMVEIEANANMAGYYIDRLEELEKQGVTTSAQQQEYSMVLEKIKELLPGINFDIDEQTGLLERGAEALFSQVEGWKQNAKSEAVYTRYKQEIEATENARYEAAKATALLNIRETERIALSDSLSQAEASRDAAMNRLAEVQERAASTTEDLSMEVHNAEVEYQYWENQVGILNNQLDENESEQYELNEQIDEANRVIEENAETVAVATEAYEKMCYGSEYLGDETDSTAASVAALTEAYNTAKDEAKTSIDAQIGYFDELAMESDTSAAKIIENWANQKKAFDNYSANLQKAVDMGLDEALVQQLSDGSEQSMLILDALVNDTETSVAEINAAFADNTDARDNMTSTMAEVSVALNGELAGMVADAKASGGYIGDGIAEGIRGKIGLVQSAMDSLATGSVIRFNQTLSINSPSRVMKRQAAWIPKGAALGVTDAAEEFERSMQQLADAGLQAFAEDIDSNLYIQPTVGREVVASETHNSATYGDVQLIINQQPGEDAEALAYRVMDIMQTAVMRKGASLNG